MVNESSLACCDPTSYTSNVLIAFFVCTFLVFGTFGNITTMLVIIKNKSLHTSSNYFIFSLCISDLVSGLICSPMWLYKRTWGFCLWETTTGLCSFYWASDFTTNYATTLHILSFAIFRYIAVYWPFKLTLFTKRRLVVYFCVLWLIAIMVAMPLFWLTGVEHRGGQDHGKFWPSCSICSDSHCLVSYTIYMTFATALFFYFPLLCVVILSLFIVKAVLRRKRWRKSATSVYALSENIATKRQLSVEQIPDVVPNDQVEIDSSEEEEELQTNEPYRPQLYLGQTHLATDAPTQQRRPKRPNRGARAQNERHIFTQLSLIVVTFVIGYVPTGIYRVWTTIDNHADQSFDYWFGIVSYLSLRFSECMNPIVYNLGSSKIRNATKKLFKIESSADVPSQ